LNCPGAAGRPPGEKRSRHQLPAAVPAQLTGLSQARATRAVPGKLSRHAAASQAEPCTTRRVAIARHNVRPRR
jgi:hypothetical protein